MAVKEKNGTAPIEQEDPLGHRFHQALHKLWSVMHPMGRETVCFHDITLTQWHLLSALCEKRLAPLTMSFLALRLGLTPSGLTRCSNPLVERGLVKRGQNPNDRRVCCLQPTAKGVLLCEKIQCECTKREGQLIGHLPSEESEGFVASLEHLARAAELSSRE